MVTVSLNTCTHFISVLLLCVFLSLVHKLTAEKHAPTCILIQAWSYLFQYWSAVMLNQCSSCYLGYTRVTHWYPRPQELIPFAKWLYHKINGCFVTDTGDNHAEKGRQQCRKHACGWYSNHHCEDGPETQFSVLCFQETLHYFSCYYYLIYSW